MRKVEIAKITYPARFIKLVSLLFFEYRKAAAALKAIDDKHHQK
jgi:hypothetical protein